jgi:hypothetical protein
MAAENLSQPICSAEFDPTEYRVCQAVFGMILVVIIAFEFKRSLLVVAERSISVVQVRTVVLITLLDVLALRRRRAICRSASWLN